MGIRGLTEAIRRYGKLDVLNGDSVVIDGPSLVYKIALGCLVLRPSPLAYFCQPSYAQLGHFTISWLDKLKSHNVTVRKIYFDGYLPPSKWDVRLDRLIRETERLKRVASIEHDGVLVSPENPFASAGPDFSMTRGKGQSINDALPRPAFLIPAVIDALRGHEYWRSVVQIVPAEADDVCAADVRENGGTVITSDSDLLIQDLGPEGFVSFFTDFTESSRDRESKLYTLKFSYRELNQQMALENLGGLVRVAFEMETRRASLESAIDLVKKDAEEFSESSRFAKFEKFKEEHSNRVHVPPDHPILGTIANLDPRISEIAIQSQILKNSNKDPASGAARGHDDLSMFLPIMTENPHKQSSWTMSTRLRELAYSLIQTIASFENEFVIEYRTLSTSRAFSGEKAKGGRKVDILDKSQTPQECAELCKTFSTLDQVPELSRMRWLAFAIQQEVLRASEEGSIPTTALLLDQAIRSEGRMERYSWELVHFTAQVNATLYSFRMIQQALMVISVLQEGIRDEPVTKLQTLLQDLPRIEKWPTIDTIHTDLVRFGTSGLSAITESLGLPDIDMTELSRRNTKKRKEQGSGAYRAKRPPPGPRPSNPFALLNPEDGD